MCSCKRQDEQRELWPTMNTTHSSSGVANVHRWPPRCSCHLAPFFIKKGNAIFFDQLLVGINITAYKVSVKTTKEPVLSYRCVINYNNKGFLRFRHGSRNIIWYNFFNSKHYKSAQAYLYRQLNFKFVSTRSLARTNLN